VEIFVIRGSNICAVKASSGRLCEGKIFEDESEIVDQIVQAINNLCAQDEEEANVPKKSKQKKR
jgi:hypothetical protein